ncbi:hypothetical protein ACH5RR_006962, partial [Cinchona calisaya]
PPHELLEIVGVRKQDNVHVGTMLLPYDGDRISLEFDDTIFLELDKRIEDLGWKKLSSSTQPRTGGDRHKDKGLVSGESFWVTFRHCFNRGVAEELEELWQKLRIIGLEEIVISAPREMHDGILIDHGNRDFTNEEAITLQSKNQLPQYGVWLKAGNSGGERERNGGNVQISTQVDLAKKKTNPMKPQGSCRTSKRTWKWKLKGFNLQGSNQPLTNMVKKRSLSPVEHVVPELAEPDAKRRATVTESMDLLENTILMAEIDNQFG